MLLKKEIDTYVESFSKNKLYTFDFGEGNVYSGLLWITRGVNE